MCLFFEYGTFLNKLIDHFCHFKKMINFGLVYIISYSLIELVYRCFGYFSFFPAQICQFDKNTPPVFRISLTADQTFFFHAL